MEKERFQGDLTAAFQYLKRTFKKRKNIFLHSQIVSGRGNGFKTKEEKFGLDVRTKFFYSLLIGW